MATHSSILAWGIPWTKEPGELQFMRSQRVRQDRAPPPPPPSREYSQYFIITLSCVVAQLVKNLLAMQETWVQSLGWEDPLEKGKAMHSSILAWRIPWTLNSMGSQRVGDDSVTFTFIELYFSRMKYMWFSVNMQDISSLYQGHSLNQPLNICQGQEHTAWVCGCDFGTRSKEGQGLARWVVRFLWGSDVGARTSPSTYGTVFTSWELLMMQVYVLISKPCWFYLSAS